MPLSRPELLAHAGFFQQCSSCQDIFFAALPAGDDRWHGVVVDTARHRLACTCEFRPKPCVHARALELLLKNGGAELFEPVGAAPDWVAAVLDGQRIAVGSPPPARPAARLARRSDRLERAARGFDDLELWLHDTVRRGLATALAEDPSVFAGIAGRLADAKLSALSRQFRLLHERAADGPGWEEAAAAGLADAYFALRAFGQRERLPAPMLYDLEAAIGIALRKDDVLVHGDALTDIWAVLGQREEALENQLRQRRTWLYGGRSGRYALLLEHEFGGAFAPGFTPGGVVQATLAYYPGAWPMRALLSGEATTVQKKVEKLPGHTGLEAALAEYAGALGQQPWLGAWPLALQQARPYVAGGDFYCADGAGKSIRVDVPAQTGWQLLALSGGQPIGIFGEWQEGALTVLGAVAGQRYVAL